MENKSEIDETAEEVVEEVAKEAPVETVVEAPEEVVVVKPKKLGRPPKDRTLEPPKEKRPVGRPPSKEKPAPIPKAPSMTPLEQLMSAMQERTSRQKDQRKQLYASFMPRKNESFM